MTCQQTLYLLALFSLSIHHVAHAITPGLSVSHGALLYDTQQPNGPDSTPITAQFGMWAPNIEQFNSGASASTQITRLYPYSGDIKIQCTDPTACVYSGPGQNVFVGYNPPFFGKDSVAAYRASFPNALILAIIDGDLDNLSLLNNTEVGVGVANALTAQICADPKVDGVFFDLEPFSATSFESPGLFALYSTTAKNLASSACMDSNHPNGRYMAIFMNPNKVENWNQVGGMLGNNSYLVVGAYDVNDTTPPRPTPYTLYTSSITGKLQGFMDPNSQMYHLPYTVAIPAASSFSEFEQFGFYNTAYPDDFMVSTDFRTQNFTQLAYVQSARAMILANCKSASFLGTDYWSWSQYKSPDPQQNQMLLPNIPAADVVQYLQKYG